MMLLDVCLQLRKMIEFGIDGDTCVFEDSKKMGGLLFHSEGCEEEGKFVDESAAAHNEPDSSGYANGDAEPEGVE